MRVADEIVRNEVPYVMLCGGEPLVVPHFFALAETLGHAGVQLKIETNGQRFDTAVAERLARLPIRSIQISLDGDTQEVYERQRPGGSLAKAHAACRAVRAAGLPLEITFAPTRLNIHEARAGDRAGLGLRRVPLQYRQADAHRHGGAPVGQAGAHRADNTGNFAACLARRRTQLEHARWNFATFLSTMAEALRRQLEEPPATLLVLPNGWVKVAAALPHICADLRRETLPQAWEAYRGAWRDEAIVAAVQRRDR